MGKKRGLDSVKSEGKMQPASEAVAGLVPEGPRQPQVVYRLAGDACLLVEYGAMVLDLNLRIRVHSLEEAIKNLHMAGLLETIPGLRSLLIKYDPLQLPLRKLLDTLQSIEKEILV